jgi:ATP-dependent helicase Lhr and Lhr-like helicase
MQQKWLEPAETQRMHLSTLVHQVFSHLKQTGGMSAANLHEALAVKGPFRSVSVTDFALLLRTLAAKQLVEQIPTGEIILTPAAERITSAHDFYAAFKSSEMFTVRHDKSEIGELPLDALPPAGQLVILAGKRWLVGEIDAATKTVWVTPAKGGKIPIFLGNGGDLHTRIVQEMKLVLLSDDEPAYLDNAGRELLRTARHVATTVGLGRSDVLAAPGGVRWFPWVGTRCLRTLAIMAELNGVNCETDRLSLWLPVAGESEFRDFAKRLTNSSIVPQQLGARVTPRAVEKFDEYLPDELLTKACAVERLAIEESQAALSKACSP